MNNDLIIIENVDFSYENSDGDIQVIKNLNLNIEKGSFTVILGRNGSGKSTLAKLMNGMYRPALGKVTVAGLDTGDENNEIEIKRKVGLVFQNPDNQLIASIVEEDVAFGPENLGLAPEEIRRRVDESLKAVNMYDYRNHAPHKLSGGQKQRVAIAGMIAMQPECLVLDEPTAMLDPRGRAEVIDAICKLNKDHGMTVVLITHFMNEAERADRVIVMNEGSVAFEGTPKEVFSKCDLLRKFGLDVPQTTELLTELKNEGIDIDLSAVNNEECATALYNLFSKHSERKK